MDLAKNTIKNASWQYISLLLQMILQTIVMMVMARYVEPKEYGIITIVNIIILFTSGMYYFRRMEKTFADVV